MKVLITGATGFVGRYVVKEAYNRGYHVGCLVRDKSKLSRFFGKSVEGFEVDFDDKRSISKAFERFKPDYLIHLIGILVENKRRRETFTRVHYVYAKNLYDVAKEFQVKKVIHMSSLGTHKNAPSMYHRTKYMAEQELKNSSLTFTIFRPSMILGPEQKLFYDMWTITKYIKVIALPGGGHYQFQPVDVRDVACAFVSAIEKEETNGKIYELCGPDRVSFKELLEDIFKRWGRKVLLLPVPKSLMYVGGLFVEKLIQPPPFSSDQMLMMWRDNVCCLDDDVECDGVVKICNKPPIPYKDALDWAIDGFHRLIKG